MTPRAGERGGRLRDRRAEEGGGHRGAERLRGGERLERGAREGAVGIDVADEQDGVHGRSPSCSPSRSTRRSLARSRRARLSFTIRVSRCTFGSCTEANSTPPVPTGEGAAFCRAGITSRMLAMPICGLFFGSGRLPVAQPSTAGAPAQVETWCLPPSTRSSTSKEPSGQGRDPVHALELLLDLEQLADELQRHARAARGRLPPAEQEQPRRGRGPGAPSPRRRASPRPRARR